ncbi:MAG: ATP-dependent zinc metalloprotease FtsH [candidate division WOR-3 bacterium]|nr:ATP-dependent zinc metalloprotease FtsH [candidate division WOR-3 bacterium]
MKRFKPQGSQWRSIFIWISLIAVFIIVSIVYSSFNNQYEEIEYSQFNKELNAGKIESVTITGKDISGRYRDAEKGFKTRIPYEDSDLIREMVEMNVEISVEPPGSFWSNVLPYLLPIVMFAFFWFLIFRQMSSGQNKAFRFGKSKAKMVLMPKVKFSDVAGVKEAKAELSEIVDFLKHPGKYTRLGGKIPRGVILMGAPGTGKTLLAKSVAGEAGTPFYTISGSDFVEMFVGVGASRVRDLFNKAKANSPSIIFIDEIDAVGRHRGAGIGGGHDEREQTLNQLLVEMDGFDTNEGVIIMAATNRPDILDPALLRPGRFDRRVIVNRPDVRGREKIFEIHTRKIPISDDVDFIILAKATPGFVGADIANMVNEAALLAARRDKKQVEMEDFEEAKDKVIMGLERKSAVISDEEKRISAYHESGHVIASKFSKHADSVHKVTVIPRGRALGVTQYLPEDDKHMYSKDYLLDQIVSLLGGRAAETLILESVTTGAGNDIERATKIAHKMVCEWGMSDKIGPLSYADPNDNIFLGREISQHKDYSDETASVIDREIKDIVNTALNKASKILGEHRDILERMAEALLERETLNQEEIDMVIEDKELPPIEEEIEEEENADGEEIQETEDKNNEDEADKADGENDGENR